MTANSLNKVTALGNSIVTVKSAETYGQFFFEDARELDTIGDSILSTTTTATKTTIKQAVISIFSQYFSSYNSLI